MEMKSGINRFSPMVKKINLELGQIMKWTIDFDKNKEEAQLIFDSESVHLKYGFKVNLNNTTTQNCYRLSLLLIESLFTVSSKDWPALFVSFHFVFFYFCHVTSQ